VLCAEKRLSDVCERDGPSAPLPPGQTLTAVVVVDATLPQRWEVIRLKPKRMTTAAQQDQRAGRRRLLVLTHWRSPAGGGWTLQERTSWIRWRRWSGSWQKSEDYTTSFIESDHETDKEREANKKKNCCQVSSPTALDDEFSSKISGYKGTGVRTIPTFRADVNCQFKDDSRFLHADLHRKC
jgi:hypothetical protein